MAYPKARFSTRLPDGDYLTLAVWPGKKDPSAEVLTIQLRRLEGDTWKTAGRLAIYRTNDGVYSQLPERPQEERPKVEEPREPGSEAGEEAAEEGLGWE